MSMKSNAAFIAIVMMLAAGRAEADPVTVAAVGDGATRAEAVATALANAVEQVLGVRIEAHQTLQSELSSISTPETTTATLSESQQKEIRKQAGGIISSYEFVSDDKTPDGGVEVRLSVTIEKFEAKGNATDNRRRLVVGNISYRDTAPCEQSVTSDGVGIADTRDDAINAALSEGVAKINGASVQKQSDPNATVTTKQLDASASSQSASGAAAVSQSTAFAANSRGNAAIAGAQSKAAAVAVKTQSEQLHIKATTRTGKVEILTSSGGSVKNFTIVSLDTDETGHIIARVRMEVSQCPSSAAFAARLVERLTSYLTRTRRFAVLDRMQDSAYAKEMELIQSEDVPLKDRVRIGQVLATDYILVGKLNSFDTGVSTKTNALTGDTKAKKQFSASVDFQIIDIATRQIKWSGTTKLASPSVEALAAALAQSVGEDVSQTIYPLRAIKFDDPKAVVVNQGGDTLKVGQIYKAFKLGDELTDPYTKEPLGRAEQEIATLKITRVDAKVSYGEVQFGAMAGGDDVLLRRAKAGDPPAAGGAVPAKAASTPFD